MEKFIRENLPHGCVKYLQLYQLMLQHVQQEEIGLEEAADGPKASTVERVFETYFAAQLTSAEAAFSRTLSNHLPENQVFTLLALLHFTLSYMQWNQLMHCCLEIDRLISEYGADFYNFYHDLGTVSQSCHFAIPFLLSGCVTLLATSDFAETLMLLLHSTRCFSDIEVFQRLLADIYHSRYLSGMTDERVFIFQDFTVDKGFVMRSIAKHENRGTVKIMAPRIEFRMQDPFAHEKLASMHQNNFALLSALNDVIVMLDRDDFAALSVYDGLKQLQFACYGKMQFVQKAEARAYASEWRDTVAWLLSKSVIH